MTEKRANEIFKTKYPNGEIVRKYASSAEWKYWVVFDTSKEFAKAYYYSAPSYQQLLERLGFKIAYKHNIENAKNTLSGYEKQLEDLLNGVKPPFFNIFGDMSDEEAMEWEISKTKEEIVHWTEELRYLTEECILG